MKDKLRIVASVILFMMCLCLLQVIVASPYNEAWGWLSLAPAEVQSAGKLAMPVVPAMIPVTYTTHIAVEDAARPSDEVDRSGRVGCFDPSAPDIRVDFPEGAVSSPAEVRAYRLAALPLNVSPPAIGIVGSPFYLGVWVKGQGRTVSQFDQSIVINVGYDESALSQINGINPPGQPTTSAVVSQLGLSTNLPLAMVVYPALSTFLSHTSPPNRYSYLSPAQEDKLRLSMYNPATETWVKLCSRTDTVANKVSAALVLPTQVEEGGNALFAVILDDTPALEQVVDDQGNTMLSIPGDNFRLGILAGTVEVGTHFEITRVLDAPDSDLLKLLPTPFDVKACYADYTTANGIRQITELPKPIKVEFDFDANILSRAGGKSNLTIAGLQGRQWVDLEELGARVVRSDMTIAVDTGDLTTFGMAVR